MKNFVRDSTVRIQVWFFDINGNILTPPAANVTLSYVPLGATGPRSFLTYPMVQQMDLSWQYDWDSTVSEPCIVHGHATTSCNPQIASADFNCRLTGNHANRELVGDDVVD